MSDGLNHATTEGAITSEVIPLHFGNTANYLPNEMRRINTFEDVELYRFTQQGVDFAISMWTREYQGTLGQFPALIAKTADGWIPVAILNPIYNGELNMGMFTHEEDLVQYMANMSSKFSDALKTYLTPTSNIPAGENWEQVYGLMGTLEVDDENNISFNVQI